MNFYKTKWLNYLDWILGRIPFVCFVYFALRAYLLYTKTVELEKLLHLDLIFGILLAITVLYIIFYIIVFYKKYNISSKRIELMINKVFNKNADIIENITFYKNEAEKLNHELNESHEENKRLKEEIESLKATITDQENTIAELKEHLPVGNTCEKTNREEKVNNDTLAKVAGWLEVAKDKDKDLLTIGLEWLRGNCTQEKAYRACFGGEGQLNDNEKQKERKLRRQFIKFAKDQGFDFSYLENLSKK